MALGLGEVHSAGAAHYLRVCGGDGGTGDLVEGPQEYRYAAYVPANLLLLPAIVLNRGGFIWREKKI